MSEKRVAEKRIEVQSTDALSEDDVARIMELRSRIDFAVPNKAWTPWGQKKWHVLVWLGDELVSHVGLLTRHVRAGESVVSVAGVYSVMTAPDRRGNGLATAALSRAVEFMRSDLDSDFGLLLCPDRMLPFYDALGWLKVEDTVVFDQPSGKTVSVLNAVVLPLRGTGWPSGTLDFCGPPW